MNEEYLLLDGKNLSICTNWSLDIINLKYMIKSV